MKRNNKKLKSIYSKIFKKGYAKTYTNVYTDKVVKGLDLTNEMKEVLKESTWKGKRVVDVGCGTGLFAFAVAKKGSQALGVDYIAGAIKEAKSKYSHPNLEYMVGNAKNLNGKFDVIVSLGTLEHMDKPLSILRGFKRHLAPGGKIIITSPNWTNPRGYVLQTLLHLFDAPITLADLHYLTPLEFTDFGKKLDMSMKWRTFDYDWAHGERLLTDFRKRLPNVLRDAKLPRKQENIDRFIKWLEDHVLPFDHKSIFSGATGIYIFK
jgi:2-polyprenyl-3-methyl-5-hydroxy-6-metoxy-1,4-benzoquinol methylase